MPTGPWLLNPEVVQLNHGSFGATPKPVLDEQDRWRWEFEANPTGFVINILEHALDAARGRAAAVIGADPQDLVFVANATTGVNTVVRSLGFQPGDELLTTNHVYNACRNVLDFTATRAGAKVVAVEVPFPLSSSEEAVENILSGVTSRTRFALIDHVTSPTGLVLPLAEIVGPLERLGVAVMIDGAHGPGMVPLDLTSLGA
ncbi:MAG: aminotransferase class V-fold PLP-dependent enzyme [Actinomycetota bacterium]